MFFEERDDDRATPVAIISKSLAQRLVPNADPLGQSLDVEGLKRPVEIVGVVGDVQQLGPTSQRNAGIYLPFSQLAPPIICFAIRTTEDPSSVAKTAEQAIWAVDKDQAVGFVMDMNQLASEGVAPQRILMLILGLFGVLSLLLAGIGVYGVMANSAAQRTSEIGIRMALGACSGEILKLVMVQGLALVLLGVALGLAGIWGLMRFVASLSLWRSFYGPADHGQRGLPVGRIGAPGVLHSRTSRFADRSDGGPEIRVKNQENIQGIVTAAREVA